MIGYALFVFVGPVLNIIGISIFYSIFFIVKNNKIRGILTIIPILLILWLVYTSFKILSSWNVFWIQFPGDFIEITSYFHIYFVYVINTLILYLFIFSKKQIDIFYLIFCIFYPFFLIVHIYLVEHINKYTLPFNLEDIFYQKNFYGNGIIKIGKREMIDFIFLFFSTCLFWFTAKFISKQKKNQFFKFMLSCILIMYCFLAVKVIYEKIGSNEYTTRTKKEYVNSLKQHDLNWHDRNYYNSKYMIKFREYSDLKNLNEIERNNLLREKILEEEQKKIAKSKLIKKNYFLQISDYYFHPAVFFVFFTIFFLFYLWWGHDKLSSFLINKKLKKQNLKISEQ